MICLLRVKSLTVLFNLKVVFSFFSNMGDQITDESNKVSPGMNPQNTELDIGEPIIVDGVELFRKELNYETRRMTEMCAVWDKILEETALPDNVQGLVLAALGPARLLMSKKMVQFAGLVARAADPLSAERPVTVTDLEGFWDVIDMQIENINTRFQKLEDLRIRNWVEETGEVKKRVTNKQVVKKEETKVKPHTTGPSKLREMIAAARKAKKVQKDNQVEEEVEQKSFEAGFFSVCSPVKQPEEKLKSTPSKRKNLLKQHSSENKKSASKNTPYAMLRASLLVKDLGVEDVMPLSVTSVPIPLINLSATHSVKKIVFDESSLNCEDIESANETAKGQIEVKSESDEAIALSVTGLNTENTMCSMNMENTDTKENSNVVTKKVLNRQNAIDQPSSVLPRHRIKCLNASKVEDKANRSDPAGANRVLPVQAPRKRQKLQKSLAVNRNC